MNPSEDKLNHLRRLTSDYELSKIVEIEVREEEEKGFPEVVQLLEKFRK